MTKITAFLLGMALLVPIASACTYPTCTPSTYTLAQNQQMTFLGTGGGVQAQVTLSFTYSSGYDTFSIVIKDLNETTVGISAFGFQLTPDASVGTATCTSPGCSTGWTFSLAPSSNTYNPPVLEVYNNNTTLNSTTNNIKTSAGVTETVKIAETSSANLTLSNVFFVYGAQDSNNGEYGGAGEVCMTATPEPASMALMGLGLLAIPVIVRRRRRSG